MPSSAPYTSAPSPPTPHGGDYDPNEARHAQSVNKTHGTASVNPPHGGDMDPNEERHRSPSAQQTPGVPSPASQGGFGMMQAQASSVQYGSRSHLVNTPLSPPSGHSTYRSPQLPNNTNPGSYFPAPNGIQPPYPNQAPQSPQTPYTGQPIQVSYRKAYSVKGC